MITYEKFLEQFDIISKTEFEQILSMFTDIPDNIKFSSFDCIEDIANDIINTILNNKAIYDDVEVIELGLVEASFSSLDNYNIFKKLFPKWDIEDEKEVLEDIKEAEKMFKENNIYKEKIKTFYDNVDKIPLEKFKEFISQL